MSMPAKTDFFHFLDPEGGDLNGKAQLLSFTESRSASTVEATDEKGDVVASQMYGEKLSPSCEYVLTQKLEDRVFSLGGSFSGKEGDTPCAITNITITTAAGAAPKISVSGETSVGEFADYATDAVTISAHHHAQILFSAFALGGARNYLTAAQYVISATLSSATKDGEVVASELTNGRIEASVTIRQVGTEPPTLTPGEGWQVLSPLTHVENDADPYPTWTAKLVKYLEKDVHEE